LEIFTLHLASSFRLKNTQEGIFYFHCQRNLCFTK
jgi:hypothetical protein